MNTEASTVANYEASAKNRDARQEAVNDLRHLVMNQILFDSKNNSEYMRVYMQVMSDISSRHPSLSQEVKRQVAKKKRWQERRILEK